MLRVGITGGIGTGKTTVCAIFKELGIAIYPADLRVKEMYANDSELLQEIHAQFGSDVFEIVPTKLNLSALKQLVFKDSVALQKLNDIVHPAVFKDYERWCELHKNETYTLKEAAILFESGSYKQVNKIIGVSAPLPVRIERIKSRDNLSEAEILQRIASQMNQDELLKKCDYVIENDGEKSLIEQVLKIDSELKRLTK